MTERAKLASRDRRKLFGPAPLLPGEDKAAFEAFLAQAKDVIRPADFIEEILLHDYVYETWEFRQVRQALQGLVSTAVTRALQGRLLMSSNLKEGRVDALITLWRAGDAAAIEQIEEILSHANFTFEVVYAQAYQDELRDIERLNHLAAIIERRRNAVLQEIERRRVSLAQRLREHTDYIEAIELDHSHEPGRITQVGDDKRKKAVE